MLGRCNVDDPPTVWAEVLRIGCNSWKKKTLPDILCRLVLSSTVYNVWRTRNEIKHEGHPKTEEQVLKAIIGKCGPEFWGGEHSVEPGESFLCQAWIFPQIPRLSSWTVLDCCCVFLVCSCFLSSVFFFQ
ncbi:hypothetical protein SLA2020_441990 [Shorea laevis]